MEGGWLEAILLGIVRGISEILPISGSGHQAVFQQLLGLQQYWEKNMLLEAMLRLGIFLGTVHFFRRELRVLLLELLRALRLKKRPRRTGPDRLSGRVLLLLGVAALPMLLVIPFSGRLNGLYANLLAVAVFWILTGVAQYICDHLPHGNKDGRNMTISDALCLGLAQAASVFPGMSRPGLTQAVAWARGIDSAFALRFSYLMWLPVCLITFFSSLIRGILAVQGGIVPFSWMILLQGLAGMLAALVLSNLSLRFMQFLTRKKALGDFAYYCWGGAMVAFILFLTC